MNAIMSYALIFVFLGIGSIEPSQAQPTRRVKPIHRTAVEAGQNTGGLETVEPKEDGNKGAANAGGWNGSYVGMNAGMGFGVTAGTNVLVPLGSPAGK